MLKQFFSFFIFFIIFLCIFSNIIYFVNSYKEFSTSENNFSNLHFSSSNSFYWPTPGYNKITSYFGKRISPITGKSSTHSGIDIAAHEGSYIYSIQSGIVTFVGFNGANGYSVHISNNTYTFIYGHVSPNFIVSENDYINIGTIIAHIGPKYVQKTPENSYTDSSRKIY